MFDKGHLRYVNNIMAILVNPIEMTFRHLFANFMIIESLIEFPLTAKNST